MDLNILLKEAATSNELKNKYIDALSEFLTYNSNGMANYVVDVLEVFKKRIENNDKITYETTKEILDIHSYKALVFEKFGELIFEQVFKIDIK